MIIKSMSRKEASFTQLYDYMEQGSEKQDASYILTQNLFSRDRASIIAEFQDNATLLPKRKNGNYLYHEVISFERPKKDVPLSVQKEALYQSAREYLTKRCPNNMVVGYLHDEKEHHVHFHLMISANEVAQNKRHHLNKVQFDHAKSHAEKFVLKHYPELEQGTILSKSKEYGSNKQDLVDCFEYHHAICADREEFLAAMEESGFTYYKRGNTDGFLIEATGKKHRIKTLGLKDSFDALAHRSASNTKTAAPARQVQVEIDSTRTHILSALNQARNEHEFQNALKRSGVQYSSIDHTFTPAGGNRPLSVQKMGIEAAFENREQRFQLNTVRHELQERLTRVAKSSRSQGEYQQTLRDEAITTDGESFIDDLTQLPFSVEELALEGALEAMQQRFQEPKNQTRAQMRATLPEVMQAAQSLREYEQLLRSHDLRYYEDSNRFYHRGARASFSPEDLGVSSNIQSMHARFRAQEHAARTTLYGHIIMASEKATSKNDFLAQLRSSEIYQNRETQKFFDAKSKLSLSAEELGVQSALAGMEVRFTAQQHRLRDQVRSICETAASKRDYFAALKQAGISYNDDTGRFFEKQSRLSLSAEELGVHGALDIMHTRFEVATTASKAAMYEQVVRASQGSNSKREYFAALREAGISYNNDAERFYRRESKESFTLQELGLVEGLHAMQQRFDGIEQAKLDDTAKRLDFVLQKSKRQQQYDALLRENGLHISEQDGIVTVYNRNTKTRHSLQELDAEALYAATQSKIKRNQKASTIMTAIEELGFGDFSEREKRAYHKAQQKVAKKDAQVKDLGDLSWTEYFAETAKEWILNDFSHREARGRNKKRRDARVEWEVDNTIPPPEDTAQHSADIETIRSDKAGKQKGRERE